MGCKATGSLVTVTFTFQYIWDDNQEVDQNSPILISAKHLGEKLQDRMALNNWLDNVLDYLVMGILIISKCGS